MTKTRKAPVCCTPKRKCTSRLWPGTTVEEANLTQTVFTLRRALEPAAAPLIETVPKRGYRFTAEVLRVLLTPGAEHCAYTYTRELSDLYLVEGLG